MKKFFVVLAMLVAINTNAQWVQISNGMGSDKSVASISVFDNIIFAGTWDSGVYISTNNGTIWIQTDLNNQSVFSFAKLGNNIYAGTITNGLYLSTNVGINWVHLEFSDLEVRCLTVSGNTIFAGICEHSNPIGVYQSTDNGVNWNSTGALNMWIYSLTTIGNNVFAGTSSGVYKSTNNGANWIQSGLINRYIYSLASLGDNIFAGSEEYNATGYGGVYYSTNNGINWSQSLNSKTIYSLAVKGNNVLAGIKSNGINQTSNNGANWIDINQGFNSLRTVRTLVMTDSFIFAGIESNSVWRRPLSEIIGINNISTETPSKYSLSQNYPNPFNPKTNLKFDISKLGDVKLVVYDIMGREVQTLVNEKLQPGTYEASFDGSLLNSGVYFYKLVTDGFTETKKMLMIK